MNKYKEAWNRMMEDDYLESDGFGYEHYNYEAFDKDKKTIEELVEKATSKKPIGDLDSVPHYRCPICFSGVKMYEDSITYPYCHHCGQRIDWSEEDE